MGKVGTCLVTLAGLLLAAGAQTFTGKEPPRLPQGRAALPRAGAVEGQGGKRCDFGVGLVLVWFFVFLFFFSSPPPWGPDTSEPLRTWRGAWGRSVRRRRRDAVRFAPLCPDGKGAEGKGGRLERLGSPRAGLEGRAGLGPAPAFLRRRLAESFPLPRRGRRRDEVSHRWAAAALASAAPPGGGAGEGRGELAVLPGGAGGCLAALPACLAPPVPPRWPPPSPELLAFRAARRCGCKTPVEPEVKPWPVVFCSPPNRRLGGQGRTCLRLRGVAIPV